MHNNSRRSFHKFETNNVAFISRVCQTSKGSTIDAIGQGQYRVCNERCGCTVKTGLWAAYEALRELEQRTVR